MTFKTLRTSADLAAILKIKHSTLVYYANAGAQKSYTQFKISKRSGAERTISAPHGILKDIQTKISVALSQLYSPPTHVHGFVANRSALSNAAPHVGRRWVVNIDLAEYFPSINFGRIRGALIAPPYSIHPTPATLLARICCHNNALPQGAPSSPVLSNIVTRSLDYKLGQLAYRRRVTFTRYADDITFSGNSRYPPLAIARLADGKFSCGQELNDIIVSSGFACNLTKFRVQIGNMRKQVTGIVVNDHCNLRRKYVREIRAMLHAWKTFGYEAASKEYCAKHWNGRLSTSSVPPNFGRVVRGKIEYLRNVKGGNTEVVFSFQKQLLELTKSPSLERRVAALNAQRSSTRDRIVANTFVLECDSTATQGTGFLVHDSEHMITCAHVIGTATRVYHPDTPTQKLLTTTVSIDLVRDLAIIRVLGLQHSATPRLEVETSADIRLGDQVVVAGFARYSDGNSISIAHTQVSQFREREKHARVAVSSGIVSGMSGGPVLNQHGRVIGVVATGSQDGGGTGNSDVDYGFIPWSEFAAFKRGVPPK